MRKQLHSLHLPLLLWNADETNHQLTHRHYMSTTATTLSGEAPKRRLERFKAPWLQPTIIRDATYAALFVYGFGRFVWWW